MNKDTIGGIREFSVKDFTKCMDTTPRAPKYIEECPKPVELKNIEQFKLDDNKVVLLLANLELVKRITWNW